MSTDRDAIERSINCGKGIRFGDTILFCDRAPHHPNAHCEANGVTEQGDRYRINFKRDEDPALYVTGRQQHADMARAGQAVPVQGT